MTVRIQYGNVAPGAAHAMIGMQQYVQASGLEHTLLELVKLRASYMNGCAYGVDMHSKDTLSDEARTQFSDAELVNLTMAVIAINAWNRLVVRFGADVGSYPSRPPSPTA